MKSKQQNSTGAFYVRCKVENHDDRSKSAIVANMRFVILRADKYFTIDEVVFAEKGDLPLLGARTLEGLNLAVDPKRKRLIAAGPLLAAAANNQR